MGSGQTRVFIPHCANCTKRATLERSDRLDFELKTMEISESKTSASRLSHALGRLVSFAAVIRVVTQRFSPINNSGGEALRDDPNNGWEGDYLTIRPVALEGEGSNCFSITQLVGKKRQ